jgi:hypothetical protein
MMGFCTEAEYREFLRFDNPCSFCSGGGHGKSGKIGETDDNGDPTLEEVETIGDTLSREHDVPPFTMRFARGIDAGDPKVPLTPCGIRTTS